jgi:hypothetical protein
LRFDPPDHLVRINDGAQFFRRSFPFLADKASPRTLDVHILGPGGRGEVACGVEAVVSEFAGALLEPDGGIARRDADMNDELRRRRLFFMVWLL